MMDRLYVEQDGSGPYLCESGHGRIATIEPAGFASNGVGLDYRRAREIARAVNAHPRLLQVAETLLDVVAAFDDPDHNMGEEDLIREVREIREWANDAVNGPAPPEPANSGNSENQD